MGFINGYNEEKFLKQIEEKNGWTQQIVGGSCYYRLGENACIVGAFIPDDLYQEQFENKQVLKIFKINKNLKKYMPFKPHIMSKLQMIHDDYFHTYGDFKNYFIREANKVFEKHKMNIVLKG